MHDSLSEPVVDLAAVAESFQGKTEVWRSLVRRFLEESLPADLAFMNGCVATGDAAGLADRAHKLKGFLGLIQAGAARKQIAALERTAVEGEMDRAGEALARFVVEIEKLTRFIDP